MPRLPFLEQHSVMGGGWAPRGVLSGSTYPVTRTKVALEPERRRHRGGPRRGGPARLPWGQSGPCVVAKDGEPTRPGRGRAEPKWAPLGGLSAQPQACEIGAEAGGPGAQSRSADLGGGRCRSAAASTQLRWVALVEAVRVAGLAVGDTGAGDVPCTGSPGSPHGAGAGSRGARHARESAG